MDLTEQQADALFPDDRESRGTDQIGAHHVSISRKGAGHIEVIVGADEDTWVLSNDEQEMVKDELGCETIWGFIGDKTKFVEAIRSIRDG